MSDNGLQTLPVTRVQPPQVAQRYSHRNGEWDTPTVEGWYFWAFGDTDMGCGFTRMDKLTMRTYARNLGRACRWWGPIVPPGSEP